MTINLQGSPLVKVHATLLGYVFTAPFWLGMGSCIAISGFMQWAAPQTPSQLPVWDIVSTLLCYMLSLTICLKLFLDRLQSYIPQEKWKSFQRCLWDYLLVLSITLGFWIAGLMVFIVPGLVLYAQYGSSEYLILKRGVSVGESLKQSKEIYSSITGRDHWRLIFLANVFPFLGLVLQIGLTVGTSFLSISNQGFALFLSHFYMIMGRWLLLEYLLNPPPL